MLLTSHRATFTAELAHWMGMAVAMMLPLSIDAVRSTATRSLWPRRHRAVAGFLAGFMAAWAVPGIVVALLRQVPWTHTHAAAAIAFVAAALWLRSAVHRRAESACHATHPLAPVGWQADKDCLAAGRRIGAACVVSCWPLMLACAFTGHAWLAMLAGLAVGAAERWPHRPRTRTTLAITLCMAALYAVLALVPATERGKVGVDELICRAVALR